MEIDILADDLTVRLYWMEDRHFLGELVGVKWKSDGGKEYLCAPRGQDQIYGLVMSDVQFSFEHQGRTFEGLGEMQNDNPGYKIECQGAIEPEATCR